MHFLRRAGDRQRIETSRDHVEDAGVLQVVSERDVEGHRQVLRAGVGGDQLEVGRGQANLFDPKSRAGANPILAGRLATPTRKKGTTPTKLPCIVSCFLIPRVFLIPTVILSGGSRVFAIRSRSSDVSSCAEDRDLLRLRSRRHRPIVPQDKAPLIELSSLRDCRLRTRNLLHR